MVLPIEDIIAIQTTRGYRFGYSGMIIIVRGHEELFFEFGSLNKRNIVANTLEERLNHFRRGKTSASLSGLDEEARLAAELKALESTIKSPMLPDSSRLDEASPVMFSSTSSSFITFKPPNALHSTSASPSCEDG